MDRHQPDPRVPLGARRGLGLAVAARRARAEVVDERDEVWALAGLELPREPHQLAHVRPALAAVVSHQRREVVAEGRRRAIDERLEPTLGSPPSQVDDRGGERGQPRAFVVGDPRGPIREPVLGARGALGEQVAEQRPDVVGALALALLARGRAGSRPQQPERVGKHGASGRRGERAEERLVVERVSDHREQGAHVLDLLLRPEPPAADDVGIEAGLGEDPLVGRHVGERAQQHHHLGGILTCVGELAKPRGEHPRLSELRRRARVVGGPLQLHRRVVPALLVVLHERELDDRVALARCAARSRLR